MIQELSSKLLKQLEQDLEQIACQSKDPLVKLTLALKPIRQSLQKLENYLNDHPFTSKEEEIRFFKYIKPDFYCWQIYYTELYTVETEMPRDNAEKQIVDIPLHSTPRFRHKVRQHSDAKYATIPRERLPLIPTQSTPLC